MLEKLKRISLLLRNVLLAAGISGLIGYSSFGWTKLGALFAACYFMYLIVFAIIAEVEDRNRAQKRREIQDDLPDQPSPERGSEAR